MAKAITRRRFLATAAATAGYCFLSNYVRAAAPRIPKPDLLVLPSETDPAIRSFDYPHGVYFADPRVPRRGLFLFIPGTDLTPDKPQRPGCPWLCKWAALLGYHAVYLMYPNTVAAAEACRDSADPEAFGTFRWAIIEGATTPYISISRSDSIENRTVKLVAFLDRKCPRQGWNEFVRDGRVAWARVAVAGQSQGGGHAAIIGTRFPVARVLCFGAPKDFSRRLRAPAKWYDASVTPPSRIFAFNHVQDTYGCTYRQQVANLEKLGVMALGGIGNVDQEARPFHGAHALFTNFPGAKIDPLTAHVSVSRGDIVMPTGRPHFGPVWGYMLTAPTA